MNKISTFAPDADPLTPGIAVSVTNAYPAPSGGMRATPSAAVISDALDSACLGAFAFQRLDNSFRTIAGTATKLYELSALAWADVTPAGGYTATKWRFAGWGDYILAVDGTDIIQVQTTAAGDFADVAGSPAAQFITASNNFVIVANITSYENRVQWCAQGDYTDWTPAVATQSGYVDLSDTPGPITGIARLKNNIVVFKERSMYFGTYVGPPYIWAFEQIQTHSGVYSQESVIEHRLGVFYAGVDNFYFFDGTAPQGVAWGLRQWFQDTVDKNYLANIIGVYDGKKRLIFWYYPTEEDGTGVPVEAVIYDYRNERWGRIVQTIESALVHWVPGVTYDTLNDYFATYTILEANAPYYESPWWSAKSFGVAVINTLHQMAFLADTPNAGQIVTGDSGSLRGYSRTLKAWPYFNIAPATGTITSLTKATLGGASTSGTAQSLKSDGSVDLDCTGKFTALQMDMTGDWELIGFETDTTARSIN